MTAGPGHSGPVDDTHPTGTPAAVTLLHVAWDDPRAVALQQAMGEEMRGRYGPREADDPPGVAAARRAALVVDLADVRVTVLAVDADGTPLGQAGLRDLHGEWEVKRVVVVPAARGRGVGRTVMRELERVARAGGARRMVLQTGDLQPEAVGLYESLGWTPIPVYEPYVGPMPFSRCYKLVLGDQCGAAGR